MGRKSKKKKGKGASSRQTSANEKDTSAKSSTPPTAPGTSCWICLDEGPDDAGNPLVRKCSCRGDSAGFAHASCLIQYAETKCVSIKQSGQKSANLGWAEPFALCPNCNQNYRGELAIDLATACVDFVDDKKQADLFNLDSQLTALHFKLTTFVQQRGYSIAAAEECEEIAKKCDAFVEQMKGNASWWSGLSDEYAGASEATHILMLGNLYLGGKNAKCGRKALDCYEKVKQIGLRGYTSALDAKIAKAKEMCEGKKKEKFDPAERAKGKDVESVRLNYQRAVKQFGEESEEAIGRGMDLVMTLKRAFRNLEAERFVDKLATVSQRVLGPDHPHTESLDVMLDHVKTRLVFVNRGNVLGAFVALRYGSSGKKCVVQGPLKEPRNVDKEKIFEVNAYPVIPSFRTPVIFHGLKSAAHLNGKVGDMRSDSQGPGKDRFLVYLEGKEEPVLVKLENLRVAFDLPEPTTSGDSE